MTALEVMTNAGLGLVAPVFVLATLVLVSGAPALWRNQGRGARPRRTTQRAT